MDKSKQIEKLSSVERFWQLIYLYRHEVNSIFVYAFFNGIIYLSLPLGIQAIINLIGGAQASTSLWVLTILIIVGVAASGFLLIMQLKVSENIQQKIFARSAFDFAYRLPKLKTESVDKMIVPEMVNRFFDTLTIQKGISKILLDYSVAIMQTILGLLLLSFYHPFFITFSVLLLVLVYLVIKHTAKRGLSTSIIESKYKYELVHWLEELGRLTKTFKLAGTTNLPLEKTDKITTKYIIARKEHFKILVLQFIYMVSFKIIIAAGFLIIGDDAFIQSDGQNTFSEILKAFDFITPGALLIAVISLAILILWDTVLSKKHKIFGMINGPLVVVVLGITMNHFYQSGILPFTLAEDQVVRIPVPENLMGFFQQFTFPDFSAITNLEVWKIAFVLAIVASLETLLCVEATDKMDPDKRITPTNRELKAQGLGNIISGLIGGLPVTQVIVRSSANISFGGKTKLSAILHGIFLLVSALTIASVLNMIPLASLAAILLMVGYKLAKPSLFKQMYTLGWEQFVPFTATVVAILATDLLKGITVGILVGIFYTLRHSYKNSHHLKDIVTNEKGIKVHHLVLAEEVSFFNKASIIEALDTIPANSKVIIDCSKSKSIAYDVIEIIKNYESNALTKNITIEKINFIEPE